MDIKLKHRLVGACVILALAVFFLPMILDSEKYNQDIKSKIPEDATLDIAPQTDSSSQGSLTINLDEDEPEKAIQLPSKQPAKSDPQQSVDAKEKAQTDKVEGTADKVGTGVAEAETSDYNEADNTQGSKDISANKDQESNPQKTVSNEASDKSSQTQPKESAQLRTETTENNTNNSGTEDKEAPKQQPKPIEKPQFTETSWVIQIGSFSNKENATGLVSDLRNQGFRAYQREAKEYTRVFVGPYPDEKAANERTKGLEKIVGAPVKVIEFDPQSH